MSTKQTKNSLDASILEGTYQLPLEEPLPQKGKRQKTSRPKSPRYSISISGKTYGRLRGAVDGSLAFFVDDILMAALDDPTISARLLAACQQEAS